MKRRPFDDLGELQRAVMETLWELGEATVNEVRDRLNVKKNLAYTTVLSCMQKLEKLGWLKHREEGRTYVYQAKRTREQEGTYSLRQFTKQVFSGDPLLLFQHLLHDENLSDDDLATLRKMIDRRRKERRDA